MDCESGGGTVKQPQHMKFPSETAFATETESRNPKFKIHKTLGHARSSRAQHTRFPMDGEWHKVFAGYWYPNQPTWTELIAATTRWWKPFDVYQLVDGQWVFMPEESFDPTKVEFHPERIVRNGTTYVQARYIR